MKIVPVKPEMTSIPLGRQGENLRTQIVFPVQEWLEEYPEAVIGLINRRPDENTEYPVLISGIEDGTVKWTVGAAELANHGNGECTLIAIEDEVVVKSKNYHTVVFRSMSGEGDAPDPWASWVQYFEEKADTAEEAAETAVGAKEDAEAARDAAQAAAGNFQGLTATVQGLPAGVAPQVSVTHSEGGYYIIAFKIPKGDQGDPAPSEQVVPAVNAFLQQVITNPDSPPLDRNLASPNAAAPADLVGDLKNALPSMNYEYAISIPEYDDLDDYKYSGSSQTGKYPNFKIEVGTDLTKIGHLPDGFSTAGRLFVMTSQAAGRYIQIMIDTTPKMWMRYFNGTTWTDWTDFSTITDIEDLRQNVPLLGIGNTTELTTEDLNSVRAYGSYKVTENTTVTTANHYPDSFSFGRIFVMDAYKSERIIQFGINSKKNVSKIWYRYYNGTSWDEWTDFVVNQRDGELNKCSWQLGYLSSGYPVEISDNDTTKRIVSDYIVVGKNTRIYIDDENYDFNLALYDLNRVYEGNDPSSVTWARSTSVDRVITEDRYIRITMRKHDDSVIAETDIPTIVSKLRMEYHPATAYNYARRDSIPAFYKENLDSAIASIRENMNACGQNGDTFAFITDLHWDPIIQYDNRNTRRSPMLMKKIVSETGIRKICMGGDYFTGSGHKNYTDITGKEFATEQLRDVLEQFNIPNTILLPIMGNHDRNRYTPNAADTASEAMGKYAWDYDAAYAMITKGCEDYGRITMGVDMAYYYDMPSCNTRYIFLNTHDQSGSGDGWIPNRSYSPGTQMYWFRETLNNTPANYRIVVFQHIYFHIDENDLPIITNQGTQVSECCDTFNSGSANGTKVVAIICGHAHQDYKSETDGGIPVVMTDCDSYRVTLSGITSQRDTVNEQCFDVMTLDYTNNKIKCVRIGRGGSSANREYDLFSTT